MKNPLLSIHTALYYSEPNDVCWFYVPNLSELSMAIAESPKDKNLSICLDLVKNNWFSVRKEITSFKIFPENL